MYEENKNHSHLQNENNTEVLRKTPSQSTKIARIIIAITLISIIFFSVYSIIKNNQLRKLDEVNSKASLENKDGISIENWLKYENHEHDFSLKYPSEFTPNSQVVILNKWPEPELPRLQDSEFYFSFSIKEKLDYESLDEYVKNEFCGKERINEVSSEPQISNVDFCIEMFEETKKEMVIDGVVGIRGEYNPYERPITFAMVEKDNFVYKFSLYGGETGISPTEMAEETFDKILSSFVFEIRNTEKIEGWKVYSNEHFKYSFDYRPDINLSETLIFTNLSTPETPITLSIKTEEDIDNEGLGEKFVNRICPSWMSFSSQCISVYNSSKQLYRVDNKIGIKGKRLRAENSPTLFFSFAKDGMLTKIEMYPTEERVEITPEITTIFNSVTSSLKFNINQETVRGPCGATPN